MENKGLTIDGLHMLLTQKYSCQRLSDQTPIDPSCDDENGYRYYKNKDGLLFPVPPPPDGAGYNHEIVDSVLDAGRLKVIIDFKEHKDKSGQEITA